MDDSTIAVILLILIIVIVIALILRSGKVNETYSGGTCCSLRRCDGYIKCKSNIWDQPPDNNTIHVIVDEQNIVYGFTHPDKIIKALYDELHEKYKTLGYKRTVMHVVTKVEHASTIYDKIINKNLILYIAKPIKKNNHVNMHHLRGYDDLMALIITADLYKSLNDVVVVSNDKFRDVTKFTDIAPFTVTKYNSITTTQKINPIDYKSYMSLFKKLNDGYFTKATSQDFLNRMSAKYSNIWKTT